MHCHLKRNSSNLAFSHYVLIMLRLERKKKFSYSDVFPKLHTSKIQWNLLIRKAFYCVRRLLFESCRRSRGYCPGCQAIASSWPAGAFSLDLMWSVFLLRGLISFCDTRLPHIQYWRVCVYWTHEIEAKCASCSRWRNLLASRAIPSGSPAGLK